MIKQAVPYKVLLPAWIWKKGLSKEDLKERVLEYMERYPNYYVKGIKNGKAICERKEEE